MCYEEKWFAFLWLTWHLALNFHLVFFRGYFYRYQEFRWEWKSGSLFYHSCRFYVSKLAPSLCIPHNHTTTYDVTMWRNYCVAGLIVTNHDTTLSHHFATKMDNICLTRYDTSCDVIDDIVHPSASDYVLWCHPYLKRAAWHTQKKLSAEHTLSGRQQKRSAKLRAIMYMQLLCYLEIYPINEK